VSVGQDILTPPEPRTRRRGLGRPKEPESGKGTREALWKNLSRAERDPRSPDDNLKETRFGGVLPCSGLSSHFSVQFSFSAWPFTFWCRCWALTVHKGQELDPRRGIERAFGEPAGARNRARVPEA